MDNLRWILIIAGVAILVLLYFSGRPKKPSSRQRTASRSGSESTFGSAMSNEPDPLMGDPGTVGDYDRFDSMELDDLSRSESSGFDEVDGFDHDATGAAMGEDSLFPADERSTLAAKFEDFASKLSPKRWQRVADSEPEDLHDEESPSGPDKIVTLHIVAQNNQYLDGSRLLEVFEQRGYHFGDLNIFHSLHEGNTVFSVAKMVKPGYFDIDDVASFDTPGISLILQLPGPVPADVSFEVLVSEAMEMAAELGGTVLDAERSSLSKQTVQHMREGIYEFMHRQKYFGSVPS